MWHFPEEQQRVGLFQECVNTWLKIKKEGSGWPDYVGDDPVKQQEHVAKYYEKEQIQLDPAKIEKNPGLRTLAKMMLNSMWGNKRSPTKPKSKNLSTPSNFTNSTIAISTTSGTCQCSQNNGSRFITNTSCRTTLSRPTSIFLLLASRPATLD